MTETQAKSGATGASATPVDEGSADGEAPASGRAAVGRATVPADSSSPKFTRAPGMPPPPDKPVDERGSGAGGQPAGEPAAASVTPDQPVSGVPKAADGTSAHVGRSAPPVTSAPPAPAAPSVASAPPGRTDGGSGGAASGAYSAAATATPAGGSLAGGARVGAVTSPGRAGLGAPSVRTVGSGPAVAVGAARVGGGVRAPRTGVSSAASRGPRRARLNLKRIDPWSAMKFAFAVSLVLFIVVIVATSVLYLALDAMGVFRSVNASLSDLISSGAGDSSSFRITARGVIGTSALFGLINVVLFTALATLGAFIYNVCADLVGGIELTLAERD